MNKADGLSEITRQKILMSLMRIGYSKYEIINYLDMLINTNGNKRNMSLAKKKWEQDLEFVRKYEMDKQRSVKIKKID